MQLTQAILPVAGFGTRFLPWTKVVPKELLPLGNKPIIAFLVDECLSVGITDICFIISKGKEAIPQYFEPTPELDKEMKKRGKLHLLEELIKYDEVNFHVVYQKEMRGDGHAILQAKDWIKDEMLAVLFGDDLIIGEKNGLEQLTDAYDEIPKGSILLCLQDVERKLVNKYGIVDIEDDEHVFGATKKIRGLVEKPEPENAPSTLGVVGKYIIPRLVIDTLETIGEGGTEDGEIRLVDAFIKLLGTIDIYGHVFTGTRLDTGTPEGYKEAVKLLG